MYDLHLHSTASDGDYSPGEVVREAARRGLEGVSLTDHNGLWGVKEAASAAQRLGLKFVEGVEITTRYDGIDVHMLGYSRQFERNILVDGLTETREGYTHRLQAMTRLCQEAGYYQVAWEDIEGRRAQLDKPAHVSFDLALELMAKHGLGLEEARKLTISGGACHVPYGDWAMTPMAAVELIQAAGGFASLAHPGTIERESSREVLERLVEDIAQMGVDGIEVYHPFHEDEYAVWLLSVVEERSLIATGGSDWHGQDHFEQNDIRFGEIGVSAFPLF